MISQLLRAQAMRKGARFLPGGWVTAFALSPTGRRAMRSGWNYVQKRQQKRSRRRSDAPR
jgi:hypothetical protein